MIDDLMFAMHATVKFCKKFEYSVALLLVIIQFRKSLLKNLRNFEINLY